MDIDDEDSDSEIIDEQLDWGEETDKSFLHQDSKIPLPTVLKWDSLGEDNLWEVGGLVQKEHNDGKRNNRKN